MTYMRPYKGASFSLKKRAGYYITYRLPCPPGCIPIEIIHSNCRFVGYIMRHQIKAEWRTKLTRSCVWPIEEFTTRMILCLTQREVKHLKRMNPNGCIEGEMPLGITDKMLEKIRASYKN